MVLLDTAGRTTLDDAMMAEAAEVKRAANPHEVLLVADCLTGQDAVNLARAFDERVGLTGIVLTRVDGDGRGGAALSMRAVTGKPIKLMGTGERMDALEDFHPSRIADRILGMGDIVSLVEKAAATIDAEKAARAAERMRKGQFDLNDLREQLTGMQQMGGMTGLMGMLPGVAKMKNQLAAANLDERLLKRQMAAIDSMTPKERKNPDILKASRKKRIAVRRGREGRGHQPHAQDASADGRRDEDDGLRQARPDGRHRQHARARRRRADADAGADGGAGEENARRGAPCGRNCRRPCRRCRRNSPARSAAARPRRRRSRAIAADFPDLERRNEFSIDEELTKKGKAMSLKLRLARAGTKKRPVYHIVVADSRSPRDGRFIERLGYFNPLLPKDKTERLKFDLEKAKAWIAKGATPDRPRDALPRRGRHRQAREAQQSRAGDPAQAAQAMKEEAEKAAAAAKAAAAEKAKAAAAAAAELTLRDGARRNASASPRSGRRMACAAR